jgi:mRNA interferase HigB
MRIVGRNRLDEFCSTHADARPWIEVWLQETAGISWATPQDIRNRYATASFLHSNIVIFNVRGNKYRLEVQVDFRNGIVSVLWVGKHSEYDERNQQR